MAKKSKIQPDILTTAAQTIGSTLGKLAVATGFERPAAKPVKAKAVTKLVKKRAAPKQAAVKKMIKKALTKVKSAVKRATKSSAPKKKAAPRKRA